MSKAKKGMKPVIVYLPPEIIEEAKERAKELGISFSEFLREIIISSIKYGLFVPGSNELKLELKLSEEDINKIVEEIEKLLEEKEQEKEKKKLLRKLLEWFR